MKPFWTFRPEIEFPKIQANLPENHANIFFSGQNALSINGWTLDSTRVMKLIFFAVLILAYPMASLAQAKKLDPGERASLDGRSYTLTTTPAHFVKMQQQYRPASYEDWTKKLTGITNGMSVDNAVQVLKPARVQSGLRSRNGHSVYMVILDDAYYAGMMVTMERMSIVWVTPPLAISWDTSIAKNEHP